MNNEIFGMYSLDMLRHDSQRALKGVGNLATKISNAEYENLPSHSNMKVPSILISLPIMTSILVATTHFV